MSPITRREFILKGGTALLGGLAAACARALSPSEIAPARPTSSTPAPIAASTPTPEAYRGPLRAVIIEHAPLRAAGVDYWLDQNEIDFDLIKVYDGEPIPPVSNYQVVISSGGPMSPDEFDSPEYPFLRAEREYVLGAVERGLGFLGLCLGHQLLAYFLGGEVITGQQAEVGWLPIQLTPEGQADRLFQGVPSEFYVFQYHIDQVVRLPEGAFNLATSPLSPVQAMRYLDKPVWGTQFHPEIRPELAARILRNSTRLTAEGLDIEGMIALGDQVYSRAQERMFRNFFAEVRRSLAR